jgi:hypothetical protein
MSERMLCLFFFVVAVVVKDVDDERVGCCGLEARERGACFVGVDGGWLGIDVDVAVSAVMAAAGGLDEGSVRVGDPRSKFREEPAESQARVSRSWAGSEVAELGSLGSRIPCGISGLS